jgi:hypothetical protein
MRTLLSLFFILPFRLWGQSWVCTGNAPAQNPLCTPNVVFDVSVTANGMHDWQILTGIDPENVTGTIQITGTGTVVVDSVDLLLMTSAALVYINGPTLIINNGNLQLTTSGARFLMNGGNLQTHGNFQQAPNTIVCITGTKIEIGDEAANGIFNRDNAANTAANWQNDGGYRYLNGVCVNVTQDYQLSSTGTGQGTSGRDVILNSCFEIGDRGNTHANQTPIQSKDGDDSGNWQNNRRQFIYNTNIILANGNFQNSIDTMTVCQVGVRVNVTGHFQINSGYLLGDGLCIAVQDRIENNQVWSANIQNWYSLLHDQLFANQPFTGNVPLAESNESTILSQCFSSCCVNAPLCPVICLPVSVQRN